MQREDSGAIVWGGPRGHSWFFATAEHFAFCRLCSLLDDFNSPEWEGKVDADMFNHV